MNRITLRVYRRPIAFFLFFQFLIVIHFIPSVSVDAGGEWVQVAWIADGDTIVLKDGRHVRYIGIDTPEIVHEQKRAEPMGYEAKTTNRRLVEGWKLRLVFDREKYDRYNRILAYVYRSDGLFVNAELLEQGYANVLPRSPNTAKEKTLLSAQRKAMEAGRGLWKKLDKYFRPTHNYLGNRRSKRFHAHDCPMGNKMSRKNRIWFKNKWAAFWQGYAPDKACITFP